FLFVSLSLVYIMCSHCHPKCHSHCQQHCPLHYRHRLPQSTLKKSSDKPQLALLLVMYSPCHIYFLSYNSTNRIRIMASASSPMQPTLTCSTFHNLHTASVAAT